MLSFDNLEHSFHSIVIESLIKDGFPLRICNLQTHNQLENANEPERTKKKRPTYTWSWMYRIAYNLEISKRKTASRLEGSGRLA